jgi:hypothetical protein
LPSNTNDQWHDCAKHRNDRGVMKNHISRSLSKTSRVNNEQNSREDFDAQKNSPPPILTFARPIRKASIEHCRASSNRPALNLEPMRDSLGSL